MKLYITILIALFILPFPLLAQENDTIVETETAVKKKTVKLERAAFESSMIIENQTSVVNTAGTLEFMIQHRFGLVTGDNDMIGIWAPSNIRLALGYSLTDRITLGFGTTKDNRYQDGSLKAALLRQTKDGATPVNITYYGNAAYNATADAYDNSSDRWSYFHQLILSRRFSPKFSLQIAPSFSHYNLVQPTMHNDMWAIAFGGRAKLTDETALLIDYSQPLSTFEQNTPKPGISVGLEYSTGSHAFQLFISNYRGIVPQQNYMFNQNDFFKSQYVIGFNITRLWHM